MRCSVLLFVVGSLLLLTAGVESNAQDKMKKTPTLSNQKDNFGDPLPIGAVARVGTTRYRLPPSFQSACLSPDGKLLAVVSDNIELWELPAWKRQRVIRPRSIDKKNSPVFTGLAFTPDGKQLITLDTNADQRPLYFLDVATGKVVRKLALGKLDGASTFQFALLPDRETLVFSYNTAGRGQSEQAVQVWDVAKQQKRHSFQLKVNFVGRSNLAMTADGRRLAHTIGNEANNAFAIQTYDLMTGKPALKIGTEITMEHLAYSPDGKWLAASNGSSVLRIYGADGKEKHNIRLRRTPITHLEFSPDSAFLYVCDQDGRVQKWNPDNGERAATFEAPIARPIYNLSFAADGKIFALAQDMYAVHYWEVTTGKLYSPAGAPEGDISAIAFAPAGELLVASDEGKLGWWDSRTGKNLRDVKLEVGLRDYEGGGGSRPPATLLRPGDGIGGPIFFSDNAEFLAGLDIGNLAFHDARTGKLLYDCDMRTNNDGVMTFVGDGSKVANVQGKKVRVWNTRVGRDLFAFSIPLRANERAHNISMSPSGKYATFATTASEGGNRAVLWDMDRQKSLREWPSNNLQSLRFSSDSQWFVAAGLQDDVKLLRLASPKGDLSLKMPMPGVESIIATFSPDARQLACASLILVGNVEQTSKVVLFEMATKKVRRVLAGHPGAAIGRLAYAHDSGLLATGSTDTTVLIWKAGLREFATKAAAQEATDDELAAWYRQMAGADAEAAFDAMIKLVQTPAQAVKLIAGKIAPAEKVDTGGKTVAQWVQDLGSPNFAVRTKANAILSKIGRTIEPDLRAALPAAKDVETKRRIEELLEGFQVYTYTAEEVLHARAAEVLEAIANPDARKAVERWAAGDPGAALTVESRHALARWSK